MTPVGNLIAPLAATLAVGLAVFSVYCFLVAPYSRRADAAFGAAVVLAAVSALTWT